MVSRRNLILGLVAAAAGVAAITLVPRARAFPDLGSIHLDVNPTYAAAGNDLVLTATVIDLQGNPLAGVIPQVTVSTDGGNSFNSVSQPVFISGRNQTGLDGRATGTIAFPSPGAYVIELYVPGTSFGDPGVFSNSVGVSISEMSEATHTYRVTGLDNHGNPFSSVLTVGPTSSIEAAIGQLETYGYTDLKYTLLS